MTFSDKPCVVAFFILPIVSTVFFLLFILDPLNPTCSIQDIYFPALTNIDHEALIMNNSSGQSDDTTVSLKLVLYNGKRFEGIHYDNVNLNLSYVITDPNPNVSTDHYSLIDDKTIPAFYQGSREGAIKSVDFSAEKLNWTEVRGLLSTNKRAVLRFDLATTMRFMIGKWINTKTRKLMVGANVEIGDPVVRVRDRRHEEDEYQAVLIMLSNTTKLLGLSSFNLGIVLANSLILLVLNNFS